MLAIFGKKRLTENQVANIFVNTTLETVEKGWPLLRDFIATEAMNGILSGLIDCSSASCDEVAERSYEYADAMLKAREPKSVDE